MLLSRLEEIAKRIVIGLAILLAFLFVCDYISLRFKIPGNRAQLGTVKVNPYYAVKMKDGKTEYMFGDIQPETCTHSLFPQFGYRPCWYATRSPRQQINVK